MLRSPTGKLWVQFAVHIAIKSPHAVYSKRGQFPCGQEAGRLTMIGWRGYRNAEPPRTSSGPARSAPATKDRQQAEGRHPMRMGTPRRARAPPVPTGKPLDTGTRQSLTRSSACPGGRPARHPRTAEQAREQSRRGHGTGPAEAPLAQANQAPPETDHGTQPNTERSYGMTTKTTSARAQCKGSLGGSSCGIAQAGGAMPLLRGSGAEP